ncbi:TIR domain-containing protein [uncultured Reyranella sp.]|uniref:TIR domain-containing protein n=1 Tax=uncultured Reyranella sp. TaxID=735512 RepID=UPI0025F781FE|nr:TIR domain-containing protein [uncultured Reyranella sp.]
MANTTTSNPPKVFISYSWSSPEHKELVRSWADRLMSNGVEVVIDAYDLKPGDDKHAFMERSVTDASVSHVLVVCDKQYAEKADARRAGVGTETQLISTEVYKKVVQSKFIPILCAFNENHEALLPAYLAGRIGIDFSTAEKTNENWEQLVREIYGKPRLVKPALGLPPAYLQEEASTNMSPVRAKFEDLKSALLTNRHGIVRYRSAFLNACIEYADVLRIRERPSEENFGQKVIEDFRKLVSARDLIVDWVLLEAELPGSADFPDALCQMLERLKGVSARPEEVTSWNDAWFEAHRLFVYETFLYVVAALLKTHSYVTLREILSFHYLKAPTERYGDTKFETYEAFYAYSRTLQTVLGEPKNIQLYSPAAELFKMHAQRADLPFESLIEADLVLFFVALASSDKHWFPQLMYYADRYREFPLFLAATRKKGFSALATLTGFSSASALKEAVMKGYERNRVGEYRNFWQDTLLRPLNLDNLDTL